MLSSELTYRQQTTDVLDLNVTQARPGHKQEIVRISLWVALGGSLAWLDTAVFSLDWRARPTFTISPQAINTLVIKITLCAKLRL